MVSLYRTVKAGSTGSVYGVGSMVPSLAWPLAQPGANLDYTLDIGALLDDAADAIKAAFFSLAPSGVGEMQATALAISDTTLLTVRLAGGQPGRSYLCKFVVVTTAARTFEIPITIAVNAATVSAVPSAPPSAGFSAVLTVAAMGAAMGAA